MVLSGEEGGEKNRIGKRENKEFHCICNIVFLKKTEANVAKY